MTGKANPEKTRDDKSSKSRGSQADALTRYMSEISKIKPLTRDEERVLGLKIAEGDTASLQILVQRNLKYVVSVANKYRGCGLSLQDLIEEGNIGLIQAAKRFDPAHKVKFITYAVWWIKQTIMNSLAEQSGTVKLPVKQAGKVFKGAKCFNDLAQTLGREPTQAEVAQRQGIPIKVYENNMRAYRTHISLDTPLKKGEDTTYLELLEKQDTVPYDEQIMKKELEARVDQLLLDLPEREKKILRMRFGFDEESKTLEEIGKKIGLSRERVRQIEKRAKEKLKNKSKSSTSFDPLD
ncbi:MAG TPA: RNA polymerase sigma factor RpoD/SigA [Nitrospinaceae bacterium]|jgi:RNA polymerase primary sigma factor|nr:RNA polymerase sigma factor RpoD/SigA [Nitrospinaceae bacterium]MDP7147222.1 RNA polymerase sigma factor RpoD/SigA [Nitrospinaceae bacterium]HAX46233.1 RNA polymerase subunit sigma [Nitrospina sp.]HJO57285.1 RNA polymerase sigma factor RpoD/SigA [Nitrospinaceae bacterium]|tara:strand:- start:734 stop:1618 length:885 start_codon:yes stop_codon:yes gene_type:complete